MGTKVNLGREDIRRNVSLASSWSNQAYEVKDQAAGKGRLIGSETEKRSGKTLIKKELAQMGIETKTGKARSEMKIASKSYQRNGDSRCQGNYKCEKCEETCCPASPFTVKSTHLTVFSSAFHYALSLVSHIFLGNIPGISWSNIPRSTLYAPLDPHHYHLFSNLCDYGRMTCHLE